jgi:adenylate cyclase
MRGRRRFGIASNKRLRVLLLVLVAIGSTGIWIALYATDVFRSLEGSTINTRFSVRGKQSTPRNFVVVAVDTNTFDDLRLQWPFPRAVDGRVISRIAAEHPAAIAFDVQFSEPSEQGQADELSFLNAINNAGGKTVFSDTEPAPNGTVAFLGSSQGTALLKSVGSRAGFGGFPVDPGQVIRQMYYAHSRLPTLAVVTAEVATHKHIKPFTGNRWIDFVGPSQSFPYLSFSQVYNGTYSGLKTGRPLPSDYFRGKIVVVGATAGNLGDIHATSTDPLMPGPEVQANAIYTVLNGFPLESVPGWVNVLLIVVLGVAVPLAALRVRPLVSVALAVALGIALALVAQLAFNAGAIVAFVYPLGALILSAVGSLAVQMVTEAFERIRTRDLFTRFVPENVVDQVLASAEGLRLGGVQRHSTVLFSDVRGFTTLAETLTPPQVIEVLNHYLSEMSDAILNHGGTLVSYMGDGIFAVFGAPLELSDHADRALAAAREMLEVRLPRFNDWLREEGLSDGVRMGIGLNSGNVMSGHVGSERRVEYAAVGDTTNTASRIESLTKGTPHQLFLSDSTKEALRSPPDDLVEVGETEIRGRQGRIKLWSIREAPEPTEVAQVAEPEPLPAPGPAM